MYITYVSLSSSKNVQKEQTIEFLLWDLAAAVTCEANHISWQPY